MDQNIENENYQTENNETENYQTENNETQNYQTETPVNHIDPATVIDEQPKKPKIKLWPIALVLVLVIAVGAAGFAIGKGDKNSKNETAVEESSEGTVSRNTSENTSENNSESQTESGSYPWSVPSVIKEIDGMTYIEIAEKASPSVVEIDTETITTGFWNQQYISEGAGSGVIISADGYIITNNHVIEDTSTIIVRLTTGEEYEAELIGLDEDLDIALLKIEAEGLTPAEIGTSSGLKAGQEVLAIGNPMGKLGGTVTNGIISATNRKIAMDDDTVMNLLQTNAAINPGNSGGGLFDAAGRLIGIVNAKMTDEDIEGLGFAIPIDDVVAILDDLYDYGYVKSGEIDLGLTLLDINSSSLAWQYNVNTLGVYVYSVTSDGAASEAGFRSGDRIVSVNGTEVSSSSEISAILESASIGDTLTIVVSRRGGNQSLSLICEEYIPAAVKAARYN